MAPFRLPGQPSVLFSVFVAFSLLASSLHFTQISARMLWSASSVLDTAADLLEQGDLILREKTDPLIETIRHNGDEKSITKETLGTFLVPILTSHLGDNNQLLEYMTAAVVARATNRTLCLTPFFSGPLKHSGLLPTIKGAGLAIADRYNIESLAEFVNVTPLENCLESCNQHLDAFWWLRSTSRFLLGGWTWDPTTVKTHDLAWSFVKWTSMVDIDKTFKGFEHERCVALGGLFPGLRWRGAYLASSTFLRPAQPISLAATAVQERAIGVNRSFLAVHWRFEESDCQGHELGLCFTRCEDGSVISSGLHPSSLEWVEHIKQECPPGHVYNIRGVSITREDLIAAIRDKAVKENVNTVYLATDGWMRGAKETALVEEVVKTLRRSGLAVVGLWKIDNLPNFSDGGYFDLSWLQSSVPGSTGHTISQIEQEISFRAHAFLGSGESTWSLSVFRSRLAGRRTQQILQKLSKTSRSMQDKAEIEMVIKSLLSDEHAAGMQCRYSAFFNRGATVNSTAETYEDEAPDGWLDIEACENRLGKGGKCKVAACF